MSFKLYKRAETLVVASFAFAAIVTEVELYMLYSTPLIVILSELAFVLTYGGLSLVLPVYQ